MNWRDKPTELVGAVEKLAVGANRWSEQIPAHEQDRVVLLDGDCKLLTDYIASLIERLEKADERIEELHRELDVVHGEY